MKVFTSLGVYVLSIERAKFYGLKVLQVTVIKLSAWSRLSVESCAKHRVSECRFCDPKNKTFFESTLLQ